MSSRATDVSDARRPGSPPSGPTATLAAPVARPGRARARHEPESQHEPGGQARRVRALVAGALVIGVALRFGAFSPLWLDEAQSVAIARLPLPGMVEALRQDGSPPLYYLLLHAWMRLFGEGTFAVRALSGVTSLAALPLGYWIGRRLAGRAGGVAALLLLAASPFAIRYATETRMYSLLVLLTAAGAVAVEALLRRPGLRPVLAVAAVTSALLLTHYWSAFLLAVVGALALVRAVRCRDRGARHLLAGLALGAVGFLPWLPSFLYQAGHTGTPWAARPSIGAFLGTFRAWAGTPGSLGEWLYLLVAVLVVVALFARRPSGPAILLQSRVDPLAGALFVVTAATVALGVVVARLGLTAYASRYTAVAFLPFVVVLALGVCALPAPGRLRPTALALAVGLGLVAAVPGVLQPRTQAGDVAAALARRARAGDLLVSCPDQLGPAIARLAPVPARQIGYPTLRPAARVDWVDYARRNAAADPAAVAARILARAPGSTIWLATAGNYRTFGRDCEQLALHLHRARPNAVIEVYPRAVLEREQLTRFAPS